MQGTDGNRLKKKKKKEPEKKVGLPPRTFYKCIEIRSRTFCSSLLRQDVPVKPRTGCESFGGNHVEGSPSNFGAHDLLRTAVAS